MCPVVVTADGGDPPGAAADGAEEAAGRAAVAEALEALAAAALAAAELGGNGKKAFLRFRMKINSDSFSGKQPLLNV